MRLAARLRSCGVYESALGTLVLHSISFAITIYNDVYQIAAAKTVIIIAIQTIVNHPLTPDGANIFLHYFLDLVSNFDYDRSFP